MARPKLLIFASGTADGGGSGVRELLENAFMGEIDAQIAGVVSNHPNGGVKRIADEGQAMFFHRSNDVLTNGDDYLRLVHDLHADFVALSGWIRPVYGLDAGTTFNIHPALLKIKFPENLYFRTGGKGMHGHHVHEAMIKLYEEHKTRVSGLSMHFVFPFDENQSDVDKYDSGPVFFQFPVTIRPDDTPDTLGAHINRYEHAWQSYITNLVLSRQIYWDGIHPSTLVVPEGYNFHWPISIIGQRIMPE